MVTRQYRRPFLRSPYIREQLQQPKQQLADALELIDEFRDGIGGAWFALTELTEEKPADQPVGARKVRTQVRTDRDNHVQER